MNIAVGTLPFVAAVRGMSKTGRGGGVGSRDLWVKPGDGNWEIT